MSQSAMGSPRRTETSRTDLPILVLTNERDFAADAVIERLRLCGREVERWNTEELPRLMWRPEDEPLSYRAGAIWLRQFLPEPIRAIDVESVDDFLVMREQWRTWLTDLAEAPTARWMNPLWAARRAENKLIQLRTALHVGLDVPPTLVTNSRDDARLHQEQNGPCIVKAATAAYFPFSTSAFMFTQELDRALDFSAADWAEQPIVVQRQVTPRADMRIFVVGGYAAAARTHVAALDWRTESAEAVWTRSPAPPRLVDCCRAYMAELGLAYGAFDFAFDGQQYWFLECNQAGEFSFVDRPLELGVADAIAHWLCGGFR